MSRDFEQNKVVSFPASDSARIVALADAMVDAVADGISLNEFHSFLSGWQRRPLAFRREYLAHLERRIVAAHKARE